MTIAGYARYFKKSRPTIYSWINKGKLPIIESEEGRVFIPVEDTEYSKCKVDDVD